MKVLHVNYADYGGAGIAARRLNEALNSRGVDSRMLVALKQGDSMQVDALSGMDRWHARIRASLAHRILNMLGFSLRSLSLLPSGLPKKIQSYQPDILHLHWINGELLSMSDLPRFDIPTVWTLHDMWAFCGAEHCSASSRYVEGYAKNNFEEQDAGRWPKLDLDRWVWNRKKKCWSNWNPTLVTPSNWLASCVRNSALFYDREVTVIPNCLDLSIFKPFDRSVAREALKLPLNKKLILFGAFDVTQSHKGMDLLIEALDRLPYGEKKKLECVVFGADGDEDLGGLKTNWVGKLNDPSAIAHLYAAVDMLACPSRVDNLPNTCVEAHACGTPVVAFDIGGIGDIVDHEETGYLARPFDTDDLAAGICWVLTQNENDAESLRQKSRQKAERNFSMLRIANKYIKVYDNVLEIIQK